MESTPQDQSSGSSDAQGESNGTSTGAGPEAQIDALRRALATAEQNASTQRDLYLRAAAELDNVRKRAQRDIESAHRYAHESFAAELLPVRDSLELAVRNGVNADARTLQAGQEATLKLLERVFDKFNIRQIDPAGETFDPKEHEAVLMQEAGNAEPNSVLQVVQPGYELGGRLLRPARVVVARA